MSDLKQNNPIRVLHVLHVLNRGGAEAMIMNLYRRIDRNRVQFDFLVHSSEKGLFEDEIEALGGRIYRVSAFKGYNIIKYYNECYKFFRDHPEIKIVHGHLGSCAAYYLYAAKSNGKFTIAHSHSAGNIRSLYDLAYKGFSYPTRWVADQLFGCSTEAGVARYGLRACRSSRYCNFNNAVDTLRFKFNQANRNSIREELKIANDKIVIGTVGRITTQKNPMKIFSVFREIINQEPKALCLWVGTGELENKIKNLIKRDGLENRIILTGVRSDIPAVMSGMDAMIFPSLWEGLPVSVIESQMANLPCVLSTTISKETQISDLLHWMDLKEEDIRWASKALKIAKEHEDRRNEYTFNPQTTGYDIETTVKELIRFYEMHSL